MSDDIFHGLAIDDNFNADPGTTKFLQIGAHNKNERNILTPGFGQGSESPNQISPSHPALFSSPTRPPSTSTMVLPGGQNAGTTINQQEYPLIGMSNGQDLVQPDQSALPNMIKEEQVKNASSDIIPDVGDDDNDNSDFLENKEDRARVEKIMGEAKKDKIVEVYEAGVSLITDLEALIAELNENNEGLFTDEEVTPDYIAKNSKKLVAKIRREEKKDGLNWPIPRPEDIGNPQVSGNQIVVRARTRYFSKPNGSDLYDDLDAFLLLEQPSVRRFGDKIDLIWVGKPLISVSLKKFRAYLAKKGLKFNSKTTTKVEDVGTASTSRRNVKNNNNDDDSEEEDEEDEEEEESEDSEEEDEDESDEEEEAEKDVENASTLSQPVNAYAQERLDNIKRNEEFLKQLGLGQGTLLSQSSRITAPRKRAKKDEDYNVDDEDSDEDDEDFTADDDEEEKPKKTRPVRGKKQPVSSSSTTTVEKPAKSLPTKEGETKTLSAAAKSLIDAFLNSDNRPKLSFNGIAAASVPLSSLNTMQPPVQASSSVAQTSTAQTSALPPPPIQQPISSAQLASTTSTSTAKPSVTTISSSVSAASKKKPKVNIAKPASTPFISKRETEIQDCVSKTMDTLEELALRAGILVLKANGQMKSKREICTELNAKQNKRTVEVDF